MRMWSRSINSSEYKYGFNGKEKDDEVAGEGNSYDFGARIYDPRIGRWLSCDPYEADYSDLSPYCFAGNMVIIAIDPDGERLQIIIKDKAKRKQTLTAIRKLTDDKVRIDKDGNIRLSKTLFSIKKGKKVSTGTQLIRDVVNNPKLLVVEDHAYSQFGGTDLHQNHFFPLNSSASQDGTGSDGTVYLSFNSVTIIESGIENTIPFEHVLAHEVIHGLHSLNGLMDNATAINENTGLELGHIENDAVPLTVEEMLTRKHANKIMRESGLWERSEDFPTLFKYDQLKNDEFYINEVSVDDDPMSLPELDSLIESNSKQKSDNTINTSVLDSKLKD